MEGANTGIGKETALDLAQRGAKVVMACRDLKKCEEARKEIVLATSNKYVYCRQCDLSSMASIRKFCERFNKGLNGNHCTYPCSLFRSSFLTMD